jgi:hypothetical protein
MLDGLFTLEVRFRPNDDDDDGAALLLLLAAVGGTSLSSSRCSLRGEETASKYLDRADIVV